jgi:outer membrane protein
MKNLSTVLAALALLGVIILFVLRGTSASTTTARTPTTNTVSKGEGLATSSRVAYVDIDTLEANYEYFKTKKADFTKRQAAIENELQRSAQQLQNQAADFQKKVQSGGFASQAEAEPAGRKLQQMEQSLNTRRESLAAGLMKDQETFNQDIQNRLDSFLTEFVKGKGIDYVLSYSKSGSILYADKNMDVTREVIDGMNAALKTDVK